MLYDDAVYSWITFNSDGDAEEKKKASAVVVAVSCCFKR